jgi:DNA-binding transcriptional regulator LsrR (DeoR family)
MTNNNKENYELNIRVAWYYYKAGLTQEEIAKRLGVNRARVIKILDIARKEGIVSFHVNSPYANCLELEKRLTQHWGLRDAFITPQSDNTLINRNIGSACAQYIEMNSKQEEILIGIGWGNTVSLMLRHLSPKPSQGVSLITLSGGIPAYLQHAYKEGPSPLSKFYNRFHIIPSPFLLTSIETCRSMLNEPEVARVIRMAELANIAVVGIGAVSATGTFASLGYITTQELEILRKQGAVGDILGQFFDKNGNLLEVPYHDRLIAVRIDKLKKMEHVIGVAGGENKVEAIRGALRGGYVHSLITDERTALQLLETKK